MTRRLTTTGAMLVIATLSACDPDGADVRTFRLEHISPGVAIALIEPYVPEESTIRMRENAGDDPPALTIAGPAERLDQIAEVLKRYDVAAQVQLRFQLIEADGFTDVDPAIADVEQVLRELFRFGGYRLVSESLMTATQHSNASQRLLGFGDIALYLNTRVGRISRTAESTSVALEVSLGEARGEILSTSVVVPGGQTVVLGTARPFEQRGALILVVRPEIQ